VSVVRVGREVRDEFDCTDQGGSFTVERLVPGAYVLVVNEDGNGAI
jgi:hypothetical protein